MGCIASRAAENEEVHKLLLLGNGGSGKSTLFKQLRILNTAGIDDDTRRSAILPILSAVLANCVILVNVCEENNIKIADDVSTAAEGLDDMILQDEDDMDKIGEMYTMCSQIWACQEIKKAVKISLQMDSEKDQLDPNAVFFLDNLERLCTKGYAPSDDDILMQRRSTSGSHVMLFDFDPKKCESAPRRELREQGG